MDYGKPLAFGWFPTPNAADAAAIVHMAQLADALGLDLIGIQDHPYQPAYLETWTLLSVIAARTQRITVFPDVANLPLRLPAVLAKSAASLDVLSGGRVELGLGAGAYRQAMAAMGGVDLPIGQAVTALEEAIEIMRLMWSGQRSIRFEGRHYAVRGVHPGPEPTHPIGIWLGAAGPRMLGIVGAKADGWLPSAAWATPDRLPDMNRRIDEAAEGAGRDPSSIRRVLNVWGTITSGESEERFKGPVDQWVHELTTSVLEDGMDSFVVGLELEEGQMRLLAEEVVPQVKESVARARG